MPLTYPKLSAVLGWVAAGATALAGDGALSGHPTLLEVAGAIALVSGATAAKAASDGF